MSYAVGDKVEYQCGGYVLIGTVTESVCRGYMVGGPTGKTVGDSGRSACAV